MYICNGPDKTINMLVEMITVFYDYKRFFAQYENFLAFSIQFETNVNKDIKIILQNYQKAILDITNSLFTTNHSIKNHFLLYFLCEL